MGYVDANLMPDETVLWRGKQHWYPAYAWTFTWLLLGFILTANGSPGSAGWGILLLTIGVVWGIWTWLRRRGEDFALTTRRAISKTGILGRKVDETPLRAVESTALEQGPLARLVGYGTLAAPAARRSVSTA